MKDLFRDILMILAFLTGLLGVIGLLAIPLCHGLSYAEIRMISTKIRFPLSESVEDLAVDKNNNIIVFIRDYSRLQIYRNSGTLLRGWFVDTGRVAPRINVDSNNRIHLATMGDKHYVFDTYGNLLKEFKDEGVFENFRRMETPAKTRDSKGNTHKLSMTFFRTYIFKTTPEGSKAMVISDPIYIWLFRFMFPALFFCIFCSFILVCLGPRYGIVPENWLSKASKKILLLKDVKK